MIHDEVDRHMPRAGSFDRAAVPLGIYLAWCANHALLSDELREREGDRLLRVAYRDVAGSELAVAGCGGVLDDEHLNAEGRAFTARYYDRYLAAFLAVDDPYEVDAEWSRYDALAPALTRWLMASRGHRGSGRKRWWQVWR